MNKLKIFTTALTAALLLTGCSGEGTGTSSGQTEGADTTTVSDTADKSISEKTAELLTVVEFGEMSEVPESNLAFFYGIDPASLTEFSAYVAGAGVYPDEFGIFVAVDEASAAAIAEGLNDRIEKQRNTYADYSPDEMYKFDESFVKVNGTTVYFAVCADGDTAADILG